MNLLEINGTISGEDFIVSRGQNKTGRGFCMPPLLYVPQAAAIAHFFLTDNLRKIGLQFRVVDSTDGRASNMLED